MYFSHPLLESWSVKSRTIPLRPLWAVRPVQNLSACTRVHFTFFTFMMYFLKEEIFFLTAVISFIERFFKERTWWWRLVISCKLSPNRLIYGNVHDCWHTHTHTHTHTHMTNSKTGINYFKITEQLLLTISLFLNKSRETCHSTNTAF